MSKWPSPSSWFAPRRKSYAFQCCDCGLVHRMDFRLFKHGKGNVILMRVRRDEELTRKIRKERT